MMHAYARTARLLLLFLGGMIVFAAQAQQSCYFPGSDDRWGPALLRPGVQYAAINALQPDNQGNVYLAADSSAAFGGDSSIQDCLVRWTGEKYEAVSGPFTATSAAPQLSTLCRDRFGRIYIGGDFEGLFDLDSTWVTSRGIVRFDPTTGHMEAIGRGILVGKVLALKVDFDTLYVAGQFAGVLGNNDTLSAHNIARFYLPTQSWDSLGGGLEASGGNAAVNALALHNHYLFAGGHFTQSHALSLNGIAQWQPGVGWQAMANGLGYQPIDASGIPAGPLAAGTVQALVADPVTGQVYASGLFGETNTDTLVAQRRGLAQWTGTNWNLIPGIGTGQEGSAFSVPALFWDTVGQQLFVGGNFRPVNGHTGTNLAQQKRIGIYDPAAQSWFDASGGIASGEVRALTNYRGNLMAAGDFSAINDSTTGSNHTEWDGIFWKVLGQGQGNPGSLLALAASHDTLFAAGNIRSLAGKDLSGVLRWTPQSGWMPVVDGFDPTAQIRALMIQGNALYIGGSFDTLSGTASRGIARIDLLTGNLDLWGSGLAGSLATVYDFAWFQGEAYAAGTFSAINGTPVNALARLTANGWESVANFPNNATVHDLFNQNDSLLLIAGYFAEINGDTSLQHIAAFDGQDLIDIGQGVRSSTPVRAIAALPESPHLFIAADATVGVNSNGDLVSLQQMALFDGAEWQNFRHFGQNDAVHSLAISPDSGLVIAGKIDSVNGRAAGHVVRWRADYGFAGLGKGVLGGSGYLPVSAVAVSDSFIWVGGDIRRAGQGQSYQLARYTADRPAQAVPFVELGGDLSGCDAVQIAANLATGLDLLWSTGDTVANITATSSGWYRLQVTSEFGCTASDSLFVQINPSPISDLPDSVEACGQVLLNPGIASGHFLWTTGDTTATLTLLQGKNLPIGLQIFSDSGCQVMDSVVITVNPFPEAAFDFTSLLNAFTFVNQSIEGISYLWDFGDGASDTAYSPIHRYATKDSFLVQLIVTNDCGADTLAQWVVVDLLEKIDPKLASAISFSVDEKENSFSLTSTAPGKYDVEVITINGLIISHFDWTAETNPAVHTENLNALPSGIYVVRVQRQQGNSTFKFIKN